MADINFKIEGVIPGEALIVAIFDYLKECRATMSQENRDAWDKRARVIYDDWRKFWTDLGVLK